MILDRAKTLLKPIVMAGAVALGLGAPASGEGYSFGDRIPSFGEGYWITGIPGVYFEDTGENRFEKAGRVFTQTIGGPKAIGGELLDIALFPVHEPVIFGAGALALGALVLNDKALTTFYQDKIEPAFDWFTPPPLIPRNQTLIPALNNLSFEDQYMILGMGLTYAYGVAANNERAQVAALLAGKAVAYSYLTTQLILKPTFGRLRPVPNLSTYSGNLTKDEKVGFTTNPFKFGNSGGIQFGAAKRGTAFPSYHYTQYFAVARVYSGVYDNSWIPYAVAGVAAVSNIRGHRHWVGDMAAGAFVGTIIGQTVIDSYAERRGLNLSVMPTLSTKSVGAQISVSF